MGIVDGSDLGPFDPDRGLPRARLDHTQPAGQLGNTDQAGR
jgi:hypothetical protein